MLRKMSVILSVLVFIASATWAGAQQATVKLSPKIRVLEYDGLELLTPELKRNILPFLKHDIVVNSIQDKPYVVATPTEHLAGVRGDTIYARGIRDANTTSYAIYRQHTPYIDPDTKMILGLAAHYIGSAELKQQGDPSSLHVTKSVDSVTSGDRLIAHQEAMLDLEFSPHFPETPITGKIIAVLGGINQIGKYSAVVLNRGAKEGVKLGDILAIQRKGTTINDKRYADQRHPAVTLPAETIGELMVFRVYERVSFAIVIQTSNAIQVLDMVANP